MDETAPVEHFDLYYIFNISQLCWRQFIIKYQNIDLLLGYNSLQFTHFPRPDISCRIGVGPVLQYFSYSYCTSSFTKQFQFLQMFLCQPSGCIGRSEERRVGKEGRARELECDGT